MTQPLHENRSGERWSREKELVKMSELAKRSGVPAATIKHYIREGLLPEPALRPSPNMAYYDAAVVPRIRTIKRLQRSRYLPLKVIKKVLGNTTLDESDPKFEETLNRALARQESPHSLAFREAIKAGLKPEELQSLEWMGLIQAEGKGDERTYSGQDAELLEVLKRAVTTGFSAAIFPVELVKLYVEALRPLVRFELQLLRKGVLPSTRKDEHELDGTMAEVSESLVTHLRRRLIQPTLTQLLTEKRKHGKKV